MTSPWQFDQPPAATPPSGPPAEPASWWQVARGDVIAGVIVLAVCLAVGAAAGAVWYAIAPEIPKIIVDHVEYLRPNARSESEIARDGWFAIIGVVVGLALAGLAFWKGRRHGIGVAVGLGVGGLLGSYLAYKVGAALGPDTFGSELLARDGRIEFEEPLRIQAMGVIYLWPMASLVLFLCLNAGFGPRDPAPKSAAWPASSAPHGMPVAPVPPNDPGTAASAAPVDPDSAHHHDRQ
ncbi:MAG TPA: hypothetical protein VLH10_03470 [Yinghuangia sp.]|uniref:hypothetical protein n=1 Tax=Yinghuangia sp. YIM S10712 TaxID=3436930 RepID=UPI002CA5766E|nr:hypothetical protein [Yinghuangia sp.]